MQITTNEPYALRNDEGVTDVWWPFNPTPVVGRYTSKVTSDRTEGRLFQMLISEGRGAAPPLHIHRDADETIYVIEGELTVFVGDERIEVRAGDFVFGPRGVPHAFLVVSEEARFLATFAPAGIGAFFAEIAPPVVPGEPRPDPVPVDPVEFASVAGRYAIEIVGPPPVLD
jgi:quercetin dioxygenase-like cupin family protein